MGEWQTVNEVIVRLFERKQRWLLSQLQGSDPVFFSRHQSWATIPSTGSVLALYVKILGTEQILHAWWRLMSQEEPWSGRLNVILQPPGTTPRLRDCLSIFCGAHHASITSAMSSYQHVGTILPRVLQMDDRW